ncbi:MAG TPA: phospholipase D-like domain-containing protein, partial [Thermoanaerobaculia bacterium]|nr:phospholipase D-like domain-containing protein [Thermoanaerobaculia bacterium]
MFAWITGSLLAAAAIVLVANLRVRGDQIRHRIDSLYGAEDAAFRRAISTLLGPTLLEGNRVTPLYNGDQIFPAMLEAIAGARKTITFETFIYWKGEIGRRFADALAERARAGVRVHVLLDWIGTKKLDDDSIEMMKSAGVEVCRYRPLHWWNLHRMDNRTHRKILVVDGRVGFTGGVGIADVWSGHAQDPEHWRDTHFRVEGPVVGQMQAAFLDNWVESESRLLHGDDYFPPLEPLGEHLANMFTSAPENGTESARLLYLLSIASAKRRIRIASAYFVPDELSIEMLCAARRRGVEIKILVPGKNIDTAVTRRASRSLWGPLLECGVEIFEYQPTMLHVKVMIIDEVFTSVGSTNFDNRSFKLNDEANLNILDADLGES